MFPQADREVCFPGSKRIDIVVSVETISIFVVVRSGAAFSTVIVRLDRTIQHSRDVSDGIDWPRRTGYPHARVWRPV